MAVTDPAGGPIGIFDSGLGGLTVLRALRSRLPAEDLIYFGDTARVPYGTKGARTVVSFAVQDAGLLADRRPKMLVVACNTASAFALPALRELLAVPVLGVIGPGVDTALRRTRGGRVAVIGTSGTIRSGRYQEGLRRDLPAERVLARECPLFVPLVEEGLVEHPLTELAVAEYLEPLRQAPIDTLILGCTHYPLLKPAIGRYMGPEVALVDSAEALAESAARLLAERGLARPEAGTAATSAAGGAGDACGDAAEGTDGTAPAGRLEFWLSDLPWKFREIGERFLGRTIEDVRTVELEELESAGRRLETGRAGG